MNRTADWLAWWLQFTFGFIVGGFVGFRLMSEGMIPPEGHMRDTCAFLGGTALIGAALASRYGDRFWLRDSYRVIPPDEPEHNRASRMISVLTGVAGCGTVLFALFWT
jgi:hypothetical protein